jgi:TRAP transporter TAXI family solute receptor
MVHADSDIMTINDLVGKRLSPSKPGSGTGLVYHDIMRKAGLFEKIDWSYGSWNEVYDAFKARNIHAVAGVITNGKPSGRIVQAEAAVDVRALEIPEDVMKAVQADNPGILDEVVGPDVWPTLTKPVRMPMLVGVVAAHPSITAEEGYNVTKAVLDHAEDVRKMGKPLEKIGVEFAVNRLMEAFPVNAGAAQYFKEKGVWREELKIFS